MLGEVELSELHLFVAGNRLASKRKVVRRRLELRVYAQPLKKETRSARVAVETNPLYQRNPA